MKNTARKMEIWPNTACLLAFGLFTTMVLATPEHTQETRAIAQDFMHMQYEMKDLKGAKAKHYSPDFIQHNPEIKSGVQGDSTFLEARRLREPEKYLPVEQWNNIVDHVLVQDKYFAVHHHVFTNPNDKGRVFMDIWRVENGKMVEHWDVIQPVYDEPKNDNTMWSDKIKSRKPAANEPSPEAVIRDYLKIGLEQNNAIGAAEKYVASNFVQHSPHIPAGKQALIEYFKKREASLVPGAPKRIHSVSHMLTDGDLVLVTRHSMRGIEEVDKGSMYADLFRVQGGKIVEHWDVIQEVPADSVNGNKMW